MQIFEINIHSTIDVITNSSSEIFIIDDKKTVETVKEILRELLDNWNNKAEKGEYGDFWILNDRKNIFTGEVYKPTLKTFDEVFGKIYVYNDKKHKERIEYCFYDGCDIFSIKRKKTEGKIIVHSTGDNSIPFELMEDIEKNI